MRQVIVCWSGEETTLRILWDNDVRKEHSTVEFTSWSNMMSHISGMVSSLKRLGYFVDISSVNVLNPTDAHQSWIIDWNIQGSNNGRCFTLT